MKWFGKRKVVPEDPQQNALLADLQRGLQAEHDAWVDGLEATMHHGIAAWATKDCGDQMGVDVRSDATPAAMPTWGQ